MDSRRNPRRDAGDPTDQYRERTPEDEDSEFEEDDFDQPRVVVTHALRSRHQTARSLERDQHQARPEPESEVRSNPPAPPEPLPEAEHGAEPGSAAEPPAPPPPPADAAGAGEKQERDGRRDPPPVPQAASPSQRPAATATDPQPDDAGAAAPPPARFSPDGEWWWNGGTWLPAVSADGLWRWDGTNWLLQVASDLEPERLVEGLNQLAESRYRRRGLLLARHANDWPVPPDLTQVVAEATEILEQRFSTERRLQSLSAQGGQRRGLLGRVSGSEDEHRRLRVEIGNMEAHLEPRLLRIGREAPVPTFREADEVLMTAQHLTGIAEGVMSAHEAVLAAQAEWQARVAAAAAELEQRITERDARVAEAELGVRESEARRERRIADAWRHLAEVRMPGKGEHLASFGPIHLFAARIEMPNAAGPAAGARAVIGSAAELAEAEPRALEDLFLVGDGGAADLHWAETNGDPTPYLLVITESGSALVTCGENEAEARRFARQVAAAAATAAGLRDVRREGLVDARNAVRQAEGDRSEIEAANARRISTEQDPELLRAIERAREQLAQERQETTRIDESGARLQEVLDRLSTAPEALPNAGTV